MTTHGETKRGITSTEYNIWKTMVARCNNPKNQQYVRYGARGIRVCSAWLTFQNFLEYIITTIGRKPAGMSLERMNNNGHYEPGNVKWATAKEQANNRRNNHLLSFAGKTQNLKQWSDELGFKKSTLIERVRQNWSVERALTTPVRILSRA